MHALILAGFALLYLAEELGAPFFPQHARLAPAVSLGPTMALLALLWIFTRLQLRGLDRDGRIRRVQVVEKLASLERWALLAIHGLGAFAGLLGVIRSQIGDLVAIDELLALLPFILSLAAIEYIVYPVQRRLRDAMTIRSLDQGLPVHPYPPRARFVWLWMRHHVLFMLVPLAILLAWAEGAERLIARLHLGVADEQAAQLGLQLLGLVCVFALIPPLLVRIWDTVPLGSGPLLERLEQLARAHRVGVRSFLVWRTSGLMLNGAAIGLIRPLRYVVLTDALLDRLTPDEVEAVAAHEIGHIRHRHIAWLAGSVLGSVLFFGTLAGWLTLVFAPGSPGEQIAFGGGLAATLALTLLVLGMVSRRFERQADAFAAQHLSGQRRDQREVPLSPHAAHAMATALARVAEAHDIIIDRPTFRHGSIGRRIRSLSQAIGLPSNRLPADRSANRARLAVVVLLLGGLALAAADVLMSVGGLGVVS